VNDANREAAALLAHSAATAAYAGLLIPASHATSVDPAGSPECAFNAFMVFYLSGVATASCQHARKDAEMPLRPNPGCG